MRSFRFPRAWLVCLAVTGLVVVFGCDSSDDDVAPTDETPDVASADDAPDTGPAADRPDADPTEDPAPDSGPIEDPEPEGVPVLGAGRHTLDAVEMVIVGDADDGLDVPRDLDFNPDGTGELWVINRADDSTVTWFDLGTEDEMSVKRIDPFALHFMEEVSSIDFGAPGTFGTCQESNNTYDGMAPGNFFMGPTLWSADMDVYAHTNPDAVRHNGGYDLGSHLDMLHESPWCMGITWERDNIYWVFEGGSGSIARNDFREDHGPGYDDHSDGIIDRFAIRRVSRVPDVPSHLEIDRETGLLYIADTGNARVAVLDTTIGERGAGIEGVEPGTQLYGIDGEAELVTIADADDGLVHPSGIALFGDMVFVTDNATSKIYALSMEGEIVDWVDTGLPEGSLMGLTFDEAGQLYFVDAVGDRLYRLSAAGE